MRNVGTHWPTKRLSSLRPENWRINDPRMEPHAAHRKRSDGNLAVCCSIVRATVPSVCSAFGPVTGLDAVSIINVLLSKQPECADRQHVTCYSPRARPPPLEAGGNPRRPLLEAHQAS